MKRDTIQIAFPARTETVSAIVIGCWAVHRPWRPPEEAVSRMGAWVLTHIPTGRRAKWYARRVDALAMARRLRRVPGIEQLTAERDATWETVRDILRHEGD